MLLGKTGSALLWTEWLWREYDDRTEFFEIMPHPSYHPATRRPPSGGEPVTVHLRRPPSDSIIESHSHGWGQLTFPVQGAVRVAAARMSWIVPLFRAVWVPPGIPHETVMLGQVLFYVAYVDPAAAPLPLTDCRVIEVSGLMRELIFRMADRENPSELMSALLLDEIHTARALSLGLPLPADPRLARLCGALMEDPASARALKEWAPMVGASERTLARLFESELGTSFAAWRQQLRLARAVDLMGRGVPLAEVAAQVGYGAPAAFSTMFKRALGVPPSRFTLSPGPA
jgi:AraC-like DNA-binding protein